MFDELLTRAVRTALGEDDRKALDRFRSDDSKPDAEKRWSAYLHGEIARRAGRVVEAHHWLNLAGELTSDGKPLILRADMASCQAELELADDEPQRALDWASRAWSAHIAVSERALESQEALAALLSEIDTQFVALCAIARADADVAPMMRRAAWMNDRFVLAVIEDARRLIRLAGQLQLLDAARRAAADTIAWSEGAWPFMMAVMTEHLPQAAAAPSPMLARLEASLAPMRRTLQVEVNTQLGDAEDADGNHEAAMHLFDRAAALANESDEPYWTNWALQLALNSANQYAKLGRHVEAQQAYQALLPRARAVAADKVVVACLFGTASSRWRLGETVGVREEMIAVAAELEAAHLVRPADGWTRGMLLSAYRLLVNIIARDPVGPAAHLEPMLRALYAIRTPDAVAFLHESDVGVNSARFGVDILLSRWSVLKNTALLIWEVTGEDLVLITLMSGAGPLPARIDVSCVPIDEAGLFSDCIRATREASDQISMRLAGMKRTGVSEIEQATRRVWERLSEATRAALASAECIYYSPSSGPVLDEFPLEALHDGQDFLGTRKIVCRVPSLRHLSDLLAPNRYRQTPPASALVVRARDPQRDESDTTVRQQTNLIAASIEGLDLDVELQIEPQVQDFIDAVRQPRSLLHFVGHGLADVGGEVLVLSESDEVPIGRVVVPGGTRAPFTYFSACEVGRGRQMSSGTQRGLAATFLDAGSPAIVAPTYRIPSHFLGEIAAYFYSMSATMPTGLAIRETRRLLHEQQIDPACWATLALFGDPDSCLSAEATQSLTPRIKPWSSLIFQHVATKDPARLAACLAALEADQRLDEKTRSTVAQWLRPGGAPKDVGLLEALRKADAEAAILLNILRILDELKDVDTDSPEEEQADARKRLEFCLSTADALCDAYAAISVIEAISKVGVPMSDFSSYRRLLDYEWLLLDRLSDDAAALEWIGTSLAPIRDKLATMTFANVGNRFGYSDDDINAADEGDPGALRRVALGMLESEAHPEALTGISPWHIWLLRWGGTGSINGCRNVLAALEIDRKSGLVLPNAARAIRAFIGELQFASPLDEQIVQEALSAVEYQSPEFLALYLMLMRDKITSEGITLPDLEALIGIAEHLDTQYGASGLKAWLRMILAGHHLALGSVDEADAQTQDAMNELNALCELSQDYRDKLAQSVGLALTIAQTCGDEKAIARYSNLLAGAAPHE